MAKTALSPPVAPSPGPFKDYYLILGVGRHYAPSAIKKAYRALASFYHPDTSHDPGAHEKLVEINEAYEVLRNPIRRLKYDELYDIHFNGKHLKKRSEKRARKYEKQIKKSAAKGRVKGGGLGRPKQRSAEILEDTLNGFDLIFDILESLNVFSL